jgi:outer membrane protein OmpU
MKKILFATTALVLSAGVAAAEMKLSGNGRMGVVYDDALVGDLKTQFNSRFRAVFTGSGTMDSGITFGGTIRADNAANGAAGTAGNVFVSGAFGKATMGDIDSALENAVGDLAGVCYVGCGDGNEFGFSGGGDDEGLLWSYTLDSFGIHASLGQRTAGKDEASAAVTFSMAPVSIGAGISQDGGKSQAGVSVSGDLGGATIKAGYLSNDKATGTDVKTEIGLSVSASIGTTKVSAYGRQTETAANAKAQFTGIGISQSLGGGATLAAGVADVAGKSKADLGVTFSF